MALYCGGRFNVKRMHFFNGVVNEIFGILKGELVI